MQYWIGLGSNLGDRLENLKLARQALNRFGTIQCSSPVYQTAAWGKKDQPPVETSILKIPHPLLKQRVFVLQPMAWIDQQFTFRSGEKIATLLQQLEGRDDCQLLIEKW